MLETTFKHASKLSIETDLLELGKTPSSQISGHESRANRTSEVHIDGFRTKILPPCPQRSPSQMASVLDSDVIAQLVRSIDGSDRKSKHPLSIDSYSSTDAIEPPFSAISSCTPRSSAIPCPDQRLQTPPGRVINADHQSTFVFVLCMFDFDSADSDHMSFKKNDILEVIAQERSGWWAAQSDGHVGWIPSAFVAPIPDGMLDTFQNMPRELREYEYKAEALYNGPSPSGLTLDSEATSPRLPFSCEIGQEAPISKMHSPRGFPAYFSPTFLWFNSLKDLPLSQAEGHDPLTNPRRHSPRDLPDQNLFLTTCVPRGPLPPKGPAPEPPSQIQHRIPQPSLGLRNTPPVVKTSTPPTPMSTPLSPNHFPSCMLPRSRSLGSSSVSDHWQLNSLLAYSPAANQISTLELPSPHISSTKEIESGSSHVNTLCPKGLAARQENVWPITGVDDAQAFHNARLVQAGQPWYLRPAYLGDEIKLDCDGSVTAGTLEALVERLTVEPFKVEQEKTYRHTFLLTFRTFSSPHQLLDLLIKRYELESPVNLNEEQFNEWSEKKLKPTQARVLHVFTLWVERYGMIEHDLQIVPRLRDFLKFVRSPTTFAQGAEHILQSIDCRQHSDVNLPSLAASISTRQTSRKYCNDLLRIDSATLARQLTLYEARFYLKVRPHECFTWSATQQGDTVQNLRTFVSTSDKLAAWVKMSILVDDTRRKRADTIEQWIKVAQKCRALNNFSSMSAIVAALESHVIVKLQHTWASVCNASHIEPLVKLSEPFNNFATFRHLFSAADGPCLPFIGIYLSDMVKISEMAPSFIKVAATESTAGLKLINFTKRCKMEEVAHTILRHQPKVRDLYQISEVPQVLQYVESQLRVAASKDESIFWTRSQEIQHAELAHASILKGLGSAGF